MSKLNEDSRLSTQWFIGVKDKEGLEKHLLNNSNLLTLQRLLAMLDTKLEELEGKQTSQNLFNNTNWAYLQANIVGQKAALAWVKDLLAFVQYKGK